MSLSSGSRLGPYEILAPLGSGGMGEVFRAVDTRLRRTVAIKLLSGDRLADEAQRRRFLQEARAASALNHPNIVVLYDIAAHDGTDFLVMEYVTGQTLKSLISAEGMPFEAVVSIGIQTASALAAAHSAGIVHRDIKPANLMLTPEQTVKVLDFGVAKVSPLGDASAEEETETVLEFTKPGMVVGTVSYMSPEQTRGEAVDGRSDLFSLGCLLYEAATGTRPFRGASTLALMHEIATGTPVPPSSLRADLPPAFDQLILACLAKNPGGRPASAAALVHELKSLGAPAERPSVRRSDSRNSIAILPFRFRTPAGEDEFLSVALADAVASRLAATGKLLVRPMASVLKYSSQETEWPQAARDLNVDLVVEGAIQKLGPRIRVQMQAHRAADSVTLHSTRHDGTLDDLFELQDRIADSIAEVFAPRERTASQAALPPTKNPLAFEVYLRAIDRLTHMNKFDTASAIEMLVRVTELDSDFAEAWGRLALAYSQMGMHLDPDPKWFERAEQAITRTLELDPVQCDALCARGQILWSPSRGFQNRAALRAINAAIRIDPHRSAILQFRSAILFHLGFLDAASRDVDEHLLLSPGSPIGFVSKGHVALYRGDFERAHEYNERALMLDPTLVHANIFSAWAPLALGRLGEARERLARARQIVPEEPQLTGLEGLLAALEGNFQRAEQLADESVASKRSLTHTHHTWHCSAGTYALCGKSAKALQQLRRCAEMGLPNPHLFRTDPHLRGLRQNPEFASFLSDLRREHEQYRAEFSLDDASGAEAAG